MSLTCLVPFSAPIILTFSIVDSSILKCSYRCDIYIYILCCAEMGHANGRNTTKKYWEHTAFFVGYCVVLNIDLTCVLATLSTFCVCVCFFLFEMSSDHMKARTIVRIDLNSLVEYSLMRLLRSSWCYCCGCLCVCFFLHNSGV